MNDALWDRIRAGLTPRQKLCALANVTTVSELADRLALFDRPTTRAGLSKALGDAERRGWLNPELATALSRACEITVLEVYEVLGAEDTWRARTGWEP
jgi:hypothetical protein